MLAIKTGNIVIYSKVTVRSHYRLTYKTYFVKINRFFQNKNYFFIFQKKLFSYFSKIEKLLLFQNKKVTLSYRIFTDLSND